MFDKSAWSSSVAKHLEQFNENNKSIHKIMKISLDEIKKDDNIDDFIKQIFIEFNEFYKCNNQIILYYNISAERSIDMNYDNIPDNELIFDLLKEK